jgi:hypothetical protein
MNKESRKAYRATYITHRDRKSALIDKFWAFFAENIRVTLNDIAHRLSASEMTPKADGRESYGRRASVRGRLGQKGLFAQQEEQAREANRQGKRYQRAYH